MVLNHIGAPDLVICRKKTRDNLSPWFINPGLSYAFKAGTSIGANVEASGDWQNKSNSATYLNLTAGMVSKFGKQPVSFVIGPRMPLSADTPGDWGQGWVQH